MSISNCNVGANFSSVASAASVVNSKFSNHAR